MPVAERVTGAPRHDATPQYARVSVIIPAFNEAAHLAAVVGAVRRQATAGVEVEVVVADDGSVDGTVEVARAAGARVLRTDRASGNPGAARNRGARAATGDPLIFLDADCVPAPGWLQAILAAHARGHAVVGGSLDAPPDLPASARCDHYCGSYHVHPGRRAGFVPNHSPANLSVRRALFFATPGFTERLPVADGHEELAWQAELLRQGHRIYFEPRAVVRHRNRPGLGNLLRRNYRWGYTAVASKAGSEAARFRWLYRRPALLVAASAPFAFAHTAYTLGCWARAGVFEPIAMLPAVLAARAAYALGLAVGATRWMTGRYPDQPLEWR